MLVVLIINLFVNMDIGFTLLVLTLNSHYCNSIFSQSPGEITYTDITRSTQLFWQ